jgi:hypothetical protein
MNEFRPVNPEDRLIYELMPILVGIGPRGELRAYGSCFIAWPHMAITARHVIDELLRQDPQAAQDGQPAFEYWVIQVSWRGDEHHYVVWTIDSLGLSAHSDLAIVWLKAHDENATSYRVWKTVSTTLEPPAIGTPVRAFGLHNVRFDGSAWYPDGKLRHLELKCDRSTSTGKVEQLHWEGRDRAMYPFPCFEVDARFDHGMSGGLVTTNDSVVCGIVCGSLPPAFPNESHASYVAMLWPLMAIPVASHLVPKGESGRRFVLQDLCQHGIFRAEGWDRVTIERTTDTGRGGSITYESRQDVAE